MRGRLLVLLIATCLSTFSKAQSAVERLAERHQRIKIAYEKEQNQEVIRLVDLQLKEAPGTFWQDSLYKYTYNYGRAAWKTHGVEAGGAASQRICDLVEAHDADPLHLVDALGDLSWLYYEMGELQHCLRIDSLCIVVVDNAPSATALLRGRARHYVGFDHSVLGDHAAAARYFLDAIAAYEKADTTLRMHLAESCNGVGSAYWHLGRNREAEVYYLKSLEWLGDAMDVEMLTRKASAMGNLAILWEDAGDLTKSKGYYQRTLQLNAQVITMAKDPSVRDEAIANRSRTYSNLAALFHVTGEFDRTRQLLDLAWNDRITVMEQGDPKLLLLKEMYSDLERSAGNLDKAEDLLNEYIQVCREKYGTHSEYTARALSRKAGLAVEKGEYARAETLFNESIDAMNALNDPEGDPQLADTYLERALSHSEQERYDEALEDVQRSISIFEKIHGPKHRRVIQCRIMKADLEYRSGQFSVAEQSIDSALALLADRRARTALPNADLAPFLLPDAIYHKVRIQRAQGNGSAEAHWQSLQEAVNALSRSRVALRDAESQLLFLGAQQRVFHLAQIIAFEADQQGIAGPWMERTFTLSEQNRTVLLKGRLNVFSSLSFAGVPDTLVEYEERLLKGLSVEAEERASADRLLENEQEFATFLRGLKQQHPAYFELKYGDTEISIAEVQKDLLRPDQSLIAYSMADTTLFITLVTADTSYLIGVPGIGLDEAVFTLNDAVTARNDSAYMRLAHALYMRLFHPIEALITDHQVLIVPDEGLYYLNFEALLDAPSTRDDFVDHLLLGKYAISYLLSATTAVQFDRLDRGKGRGTLAMAPGFSDELRAEYVTSVRDSSDLDLDFLHFIQQPFAVRTAQEMERTLSARVMLGNAANETNFKQLAEDFGIIHMGTHTEVNNVSPLYSRLVLSKGLDSGGNVEDGYLHAYEVYAMELHAELVVLTACETGAGRSYSSEGVRSLAHSFAYAGCPSLVMSLWKIDEKTSSEIITMFYTNLSDGQAKNEALRNAKLEYLKNATPELRSPFYWAGLVLVGDTAPVHLEGRPWWWIGVAVVLALLLIILGWRLRSRSSLTP